MFYPKVFEAFEYADSKGVLCVHAAGNDAKDVDFEPNYPTSLYSFQEAPLDHFLTIGASTKDKENLVASFSNFGQTRVDIFAPGTSIISSYTGGVSDIRNSNFLVGKISGTSMASPQVCGVLACALEQNPHWNQIQAKQYITGIAKQNQITATTGGPADFTDLQGSPNKYLYYKRTRLDDGVTVPKNDQGTRPTSGQAWPRPKIYRFGNT